MYVVEGTLMVLELTSLQKPLTLPRLDHLCGAVS